MIRSIYFSPDGKIQKDLSPAEITRAIKSKQGLLWVSLESANEDEINQILHSIFHFHPLAIEDCLSNGYQTPKVDDFTEYLFIIAHAVLPGQPIADFDPLELNIFLGKNYLVTCYTEDVMPPVQAVWQTLAKDERLHARGSDFLCHAVLDHLVDDYMPIIDQLDEEVEKLEDEVVAHPQPQVLERLQQLKHFIMVLRRVINPQREVVNRLSRDDFPQIDKQSRIYFRDIYDHLVRIQEMTESIRDIASGAMDIYLNSTSLRLNEVMKALTIVSTIFLPLSFIAGVYGMNFHYLPEITWKYGYLFAWGLFITVAIAMLIFFKRRKWF